MKEVQNSKIKIQRSKFKMKNEEIRALRQVLAQRDLTLGKSEPQITLITQIKIADTRVCSY